MSGEKLTTQPVVLDLPPRDPGLPAAIEIYDTTLRDGAQLEGISLTVARLHATKDSVQVEAAIIPHTYKSTSLRTLRPGDPLNIETDVLARYAAQQTERRPQAEWLTTAYLLANGY